jgi:hypothetical protein
MAFFKRHNFTSIMEYYIHENIQKENLQSIFIEGFASLENIRT